MELFVSKDESGVTGEHFSCDVNEDGHDEEESGLDDDAGDDARHRRQYVRKEEPL